MGCKNREEMKFIKQRETERDEILKAAKVPIFFLGEIRPRTIDRLYTHRLINQYKIDICWYLRKYLNDET